MEYMERLIWKHQVSTLNKSKWMTFMKAILELGVVEIYRGILYTKYY